MARLVVLILALLGIGNSLLWAQNTLSYTDFYKQVLSNHPTVSQARLLPEQAKMQLRQARGAFDPVFEGYLNDKTFDSKSYYQQSNWWVKVPTWYGIELKGGYELNTGTRLNPEDFTPRNGLTFVGLSVPIARDLIMDERRANLRIAQVMTKMAVQEQIKLINKVLFSATKDYAEWYYSYERLLNLKEGIALAENRFEAVVMRSKQGDLSGLDSTEAKIAYQLRNVAYQQALLDFNNASLAISTYLWNENREPLELKEGVIPVYDFYEAQLLTTDSVNTLLAKLQSTNPELLKLKLKAKQLDWERKLALNNLLPRVDINYNPILYNPVDWSVMTFTYMQNHYKGGITAYFPIALRKERGKLGENNIKRKALQFETTQTTRNVNIEVKTAVNELQTLEGLLALQNKLVGNYTVLRNGEQTLFDAGESSFFLVNTRETQLIDARIKLAELQSKYLKAKATLQFALGTFN